MPNWVCIMVISLISTAAYKMIMWIAIVSTIKQVKRKLSLKKSFLIYL
ncbi:hypothetical protein [Enterococcus sp. AZ163]